MGSSGKGEGTESSEALSQLATQLFEMAAPSLEEYYTQTEELLKTGGIGAQLPVIQQAVERTKQATSKSLQGLDERLAVLGLSGTPFGERTRAQTAMTGAQATAGVPSQYYQQWLSGLPNILTSLLGISVSGLTGAAGAEAETAFDWTSLIPNIGIGL
jgi:hypothetical protein